MKAISFRVDEWREPHWIMGQFLYVVKGQIFTDLSHAVHPLTMYIENLEEGPFALFTLCGLCIDPPRPQHQLHIEIVSHSQCCRFSLKKPSSCFTACHSKIKERSPLHAYFLPTWQWGGGANLISGQTYSIIQRIFFHMHTFSLLNTNVNWFVVILQLSNVKSHFHIFSHIHRQYKIEKYKSTIGH